MKKTLRSIIALMILLCTVFAISSCVAQPPKDLEKAADNLEDADYNVSYSDDEDELSVGIVERLYASDEDNFLMVIVFDNAKTAKLYYNNTKLSLNQQIEEIKSEIEYNKSQIKYYEHILKQYDDDLSNSEADRYEEYIDEYEEEIEDMMEELEELKKEYVLGISGKTVWYGTKQAIKDAKG